MTDKQLPEPIKIKWVGDARTKLVTREIEPQTADGVMPDSAFNPMARQKTQIVIKTYEELQAIHTALKGARMRSSGGIVWMTPAHERAYDRVHRELREAVSELGVTLS
mgnify:FL=1